jgi:hypothetical protein
MWGQSACGGAWWGNARNSRSKGDRMISKADMEEQIRGLQNLLRAERFKNTIYEKQIIRYREVLESIKTEVEDAL